MASALKATLDHEGKTYDAEVSLLSEVFLGREDHGVFTVYLTLSSGNVFQSTGGYFLDTYDKEQDDRVGTAFGMDQIIRIMDTVGAREWSDVRGSTILALRDNYSIQGIASLDGERVLIFKDHARKWYPEPSECD